MAYATNPIDINRGTEGLVLSPEMSNEIISKAIEESFVMRLARRVEVPGKGISIPVITGEPIADFVAETAEKPVSNATFATKTMTPYKIAVIELFSDEFRRDYAGLYDELVRRLPTAIHKKLDQTVIAGPTPGTGFDTLANAATQAIDGDTYENIVAAYGEIAGKGYAPNGFALSPSAEVLLYGATDKSGRPLFTPSIADGSIGAILGAPVVKSANAAAGDVVGVLGDWSQMVYGIVGDIDLRFSADATVNDGTNQVNLWQRNMFAVKAEFHIGVVTTSDDAFVLLTKDGVVSA